MRTEHWPLAGLRVRTPRLELAYPTDELLAQLVDVAAGGVHDRAEMPFLTAWTDRPPGEFERGFLQYHWGRRAEWSVEDWELELAVVVAGRAVGVQGMLAKSFPVVLEVGTGSWLGQSWQGAGIGREMRAAVLHLAFDGLGAEQATTGAFEDNHASLAVTRALGYRPDGEVWRSRRGQRVRECRFRMSRADWLRHRRTDIELVGLAACREMFGLSPG